MATGENIADEIKNRCDIVDVIGRHVKLKKAGAGYKGLCPFHNEKTPSFSVSEDKQRFTCYGCGANGDVIEFVRRIGNLSFMEAANKLADEYGIDRTAWGSFDTESAKSVYYDINKAAATFFYRAFRKGANPALSYMAKRGIDDGTLKTFGIGFADAEWDSLLKALLAAGIEEKSLVELGLVSASGGRRFDKYRSRVIFPIINTRNKVIGFGGRVLDDGVPKYLNSPESRVFKKKDNLYALNVTRQEIVKENRAILVEGYMDLISLYRHGVRNVTASLGTALTASQAAMLKRYAENVVIAYDSDEAGRNAAIRGMDILRDAGCNVRVAQMSGAKDPDEFIRGNGRERFLEMMDAALPLTDYKIEIERGRFDLATTEGNIGFIRAVARILRELSPVSADLYVKKLTAETGVSEGALRREIDGGTRAEDAPRDRRSASGASPRGRAGRDQADAGTALERNFIRLFIQNGAYLPRIKAYGSVFETPGAFRIYTAATALYEDDAEIDLKRLADLLDETDRALLEDIRKNVSFADKEEAVFEECVRTIRLAALKAREQEIVGLLDIANETENRDRITALTRELMNVQKEAGEVRAGDRDGLR